jgi:hypothetical protein
VHCEGSTHYHLIALRSLVGAAANARRFGLDLPGGFAERLGRACDFALHCTRPDGAIPALSDADTGRYARLLALAGQVLDRDDLRHAASAGARGVAPAARMASFPDGGYHVQRSGWGDGATRFADERFLIFDCGPLGDGGHGHYDVLSVEIAAGGRPLVMDPGRFTYAEGEPNLRRWFRGTAAHNTVCVDGLDQTPYTRGRPAGPVAEGRFAGRLSAPGLDVLSGAAHSPAYEAAHERRIVFVGDAYWIVEDRVRGERPHRFDLRWHLAPEAWEATAVAAGAGDGVAVRAPGMALVIAGAGAVAVEPGWVAPVYGHRQPAPVVSAMVEGSEAHFVTLVVPLENGAPAPALRVEAVEGPASATVVEVAGRSGRDVVALRRTAGELAAGPVRAHGRAAWAREAEDGTCAASAVCGGGGA